MIYNLSILFRGFYCDEDYLGLFAIYYLVVIYLRCDAYLNNFRVWNQGSRARICITLGEFRRDLLQRE